MFFSSHRLPLRSIPDAFRRFHRKSSQTMNFLWFPNEVFLSRGAVVIPASVVPLATNRNRIKRVVRSALYEWFLARPIEKQPVDLVVYIRSRNEDKILEDLHRFLNDLSKESCE